MNTVSVAAALGFLAGPCLLYWDPSYAMMGLQARITHLLSLSNKLRKLFFVYSFIINYIMGWILAWVLEESHIDRHQLKYHKEKSKAQAMTLAWKWLFFTQENVNLIKVYAYLMRMFA